MIGGFQHGDELVDLHLCALFVKKRAVINIFQQRGQRGRTEGERHQTLPSRFPRRSLCLKKGCFRCFQHREQPDRKMGVAALLQSLSPLKSSHHRGKDLIITRYLRPFYVLVQRQIDSESSNGSLLKIRHYLRPHRKNGPA